MRDAIMQPEVIDKLGRIALVGGGKMGEAILAGLIDGSLIAPELIEVAEPNPELNAHISQTYGVVCVDDAARIAHAQTALFAIKPQVFRQVAEHLAASEGFAPERVISIAAGITTETIGEYFPYASVIRVMPNTPAIVQHGVTNLCAGKAASPVDVELAKRIFHTVGSVVEVEEKLMDAVTGLAGCGPAYVSMIIEALADGGVLAGVPRKLAQKLAAETVLGAAMLVLADVDHPGKLKDDVCSAGGAAIEGVYVLERSGLRGALMEAVTAGADKCGRIS